MSDALDCRDRTLGHMTRLAGSIFRQQKPRRARRSSYQSWLDSFGKFFIQSINVISLGCELWAVFEFHLHSRNMQIQDANTSVGVAVAGVEVLDRSLGPRGPPIAPPGVGWLAVIGTLLSYNEPTGV